MIRLQYASDLHLEFPENSRYLKEHPLRVSGDMLILAGDIHYLGKESMRHPFWDWASDNYQQVVVIPGNHEFYDGYDLDTLHEGWSYPLRSNVAYHYNNVLHLDDTDIILSTLWGYIRMEESFITQQRVNDFRCIRSNGRILDFARFNEEHVRCFHFLSKRISESTAKHIIVATHHLPSYELLHPEFKASPLNGAFVVELGGFITASPVEYWIYGHSHRNMDISIGKTQCISNQLGYVNAGENRRFVPDKTIIF